MRIHLSLDNSQEDLSPTLESCEVCGSAHTPPGNWKRSDAEGREGEWRRRRRRGGSGKGGRLGGKKREGLEQGG